jgi:tetratricopeptide (TPR) repeat protein
MRRTLDVKFLACLVGVMLLFAVSIHFLHAYQVKRNVNSLLRQADRAEEEGNGEQLTKYLGRYLARVPTDTEALARYGRILDKLAATPDERLRALLVLEQVLRRDGSQHDIRRQLVRIAMHEQLRRFSDAREHLEVLLRDVSPGDGELEYLLGRCHAANGEFPRAAEYFEKALQHAPRQIETYAALAHLLRKKLDQPQRADQVMEKLVAQNPRAFQAHLARSRYWRELALQEPLNREARLKKAGEDLYRARTLAPDEAEVLLAVAELAHDQGQPEAARAALKRGLGLYPQNVSMYLSLTTMELQAGQRSQATACLRRGLEKLPGHTELLWALANVLIEDGQEAAREIAELGQKKVSRARLDYLQARVLMNQGEWLKAVPLLERIHAELARWPDQAKQADLLLGECYGKLGNIDQQYTAYRRAVTADPLWEPACLGMARTLFALGRTDDALEVYRKLVPRLPGARLPLARLLILKNLSLSRARRQWQEVEQILDECARRAPDRAEIVILRAEMLAAQDRVNDARDLLTREQAGQPKQVEFPIALAGLTDREGKQDQALKILQDARRELGDRLELRLACARHWVKHGGPEAGKALSQLGAGLEKFSAADQQALLRGLADAHARTGGRAEAQRLWERLAQQQPLDLSIKLILFDLALQARNESAMERLTREMENLEGTEGPLVRYARACRLMVQARRGDTQALEPARKLLAQVAAQRPAWSRIPLCEAEIQELRKDPAGAMKSYQRAIELGERSPPIIRRTAQLLYENRRYAEAEDVIQKLPDQAPVSADLQRLSAELSLRKQDYGRAVRLARQVVSDKSKDYRDYIWMGQILRATPQRADAEAYLRRAVELAADAPEAWVALIQHLAHEGEKEKAEEAIRAAERKLSRKQAPLALAQCYEALKQMDQAHKLYKEALTAQPDDVATRRNLANFYLRRGQVREAEPHLRRIIELRTRAPEDAAWARRLLAIVLAASGDYHQSRDALALLDILDEKGGPGVNAGSIEDQRARALVLATQRSRGQRRQAIAILENIMTRQPPTADDQFLLARLHESVGDWPRARERMAALLATNGDKPLYLTYYAQSLLRRGDAAEAQIWVDKLQRLPEAADSLGTLELRARLLAVRGKKEEAVALLRSAIDKKSTAADAPARLAAVGVLLDELSRSFPAEKSYAQAAEELLRQYVAQRPEKVLALAACLGRQGRTAEVLELCEKAWSICPPASVAGTCLAALHAAPPSPEQFQRVEGWLQSARKKHPEAGTALLVCLADLRDLQGRYAEAIALYRKVIEKDNRNVMVLNNLAFLLAVKEGKGTEALQFLSQALEIAGPAPELLDTRALVYLSAGRSDLALKDLEEVANDTPQPAMFFHLAQAHQQAKNRSGAVLALRRATSLGLKPGHLHALERSALAQLRTELDVK